MRSKPIKLVRNLVKFTDGHEHRVWCYIVHTYPVAAFQTRQTLMKLGEIYGKFLLILSHGHEHRVGCYIVLTDPVATFQTR